MDPHDVSAYVTFLFWTLANEDGAIEIRKYIFSIVQDISQMMPDWNDFPMHVTTLPRASLASQIWEVSWMFFLVFKLCTQKSYRN